MILRIGGGALDLTRPRVMGVLNVTPDSFSDGGNNLTPASALASARRMAAEGADILDIGGESTRPGARPVSAEEEKARILPVIEAIGAELTVPLSVDTSKAEVARAALEAGAVLVNDVSAGSWDPGMLPVVAERGAGIVLMHTPARPDKMMERSDYDDLWDTLEAWFEQRLTAAHAAGIDTEATAIDPGIGFGKTTAQNLELLAGLDRLRALGRPVLVGLSRKRFLGQLGGRTEPLARDDLTTAANALALAAGANIIRTHDVARGVDAAAVALAFGDRAAPGR